MCSRLSCIIKFCSFSLALILFLGACSPKPTPSKEIAFQIMVPHTANKGAPFYLVIDEVSVAQFYMNDYQTIADMTFGQTEQECTKAVLIPGRIQTVRVPIKDEKQPIAAYFLFTNPSEEWKILFDNPGYRSYKIRLGQSDIQQANGY